MHLLSAYLRWPGRMCEFISLATAKCLNIESDKFIAILHRGYCLVNRLKMNVIIIAQHALQFPRGCPGSSLLRHHACNGYIAGGDGVSGWDGMKG